MKKTILILSLCFIISGVSAQETIPVDTSSGKAQTQTETGAARKPGGEEKTVNIYPNPSNGIVHLSLSGFAHKKVEMSISNVIGNIVYRETLSDAEGFYTKTIDLTRYAKGIYYIKLDTHQFSEMRKIVVR